MPDGDLNFGESPSFPPVPTGSNRSRVCNSFSNAGVIYKKSDHNTSRALRRQTAIREDKFMLERDLPPRPHYEAMLLENQRKFIATHAYLLLAYTSHAHIVWSNMIEEADIHAPDPHDKRVARIHALSEIYDRSLAHMEVWQVVMFQIRMKNDETARPGKYPRTIGDFGVHASLQGAFFTGLCKDFLDENYFHYNGGRCKFIGQCTASVLDKMFNDMISSDSYRIDHAIFSDDSLFSIIVNGERRFFDVDIASCDISHTVHLFDLLIKIFPQGHVIRRLVMQCQCKMKIKSLSHRDRYVVIQPKGPMLSSGSTITTLINTIACLLLFIAFSLVPDEDVGVDAFQLAAEQVGYHCTINEVFRPCDMRFLRRQPVKDLDGEWHAMLVPGTMFRTLGITKVDLPNSHLTMLERGRIFQGQLIQGFYAEVNCPFLTYLKKLYPLINTVTNIEKKSLDRDFPINISDHAFFESYNATDCEIDELYASISDCYDTIGIINSPLSSRAIFKEYGI